MSTSRSVSRAMSVEILTGPVAVACVFTTVRGQSDAQQLMRAVASSKRRSRPAALNCFSGHCVAVTKRTTSPADWNSISSPV